MFLRFVQKVGLIFRRLYQVNGGLLEIWILVDFEEYDTHVGYMTPSRSKLDKITKIRQDKPEL